MNWIIDMLPFFEDLHILLFKGDLTYISSLEKSKTELTAYVQKKDPKHTRD